MMGYLDDPYRTAGVLCGDPSPTVHTTAPPKVRRAFEDLDPAIGCFDERAQMLWIHSGKWSFGFSTVDIQVCRYEGRLPKAIRVEHHAPASLSP